jgi:hypothetical protein
LGVDFDNIAIDDSGTQSLADVLDKEHGNGSKVFRVNFGEASSDRPIYAGSVKKANEVYRNKATELMFNMYHMIRFGHIRGISPKMAEDLVNRLVKSVVLGSLKKQIEDKDAFRARHGRSPDDGDSALCMVEMFIVKFGVLAGKHWMNLMTETSKSGIRRGKYDYDIDAKPKYQDDGLVEDYSEIRRQMGVS